MRVEGPLDELAVFLCTPARSGIVLTKGELVALARAAGGSLRVNERPWMLADVLKSSATTEGLASTLDRLRAFAEQRCAELEALIAAEPSSAPALEPWVAKTRATVERLRDLAGEVRL